MAEQRPTLPPDASRQSLGSLPEDEEALVRASKLCETCRPIFDSSLPRTRDNSFYRTFKHHESYNTLCQSAAAGCRLCMILDEKWRRHAASVYEAPEDASFLFFDLRKGITATGVDIEADYKYSSKSDGAIMLRAYTTNFPVIKWQIRPYPSHSMENILDWVNKCLNDHQICQDARRPIHLKPTRLLYLDPSQPDKIKLIQVTQAYNYQYVTLSHRWGLPEEPPKLSRFNNNPDQERKIYVGSLEEGKPIADLPRTFQDVIHIVESCRLNYLWIDSLCIFQDKDGEENQDWTKETLKMADIYAGGVFNIAATHGRNSDAGLFPVKPNASLPASHTIGGEVKILWEYPKDKFQHRVLSSELLSRGWVYQEVLFTPANLFCTADEIWWSCSNTTCSDTFPGGALELDRDGMPVQFKDNLRDKKQAIMPGNIHSDPIGAWRDILRNYTETSVTNPSDRLVAIAGIASIFKALYTNQLRDAVYHSGIWLSKDLDYLCQILWTPNDPFNINTFPSHTYSASAECNIPSWSPLSFKGLTRIKVVDPLSPLEFVRLCNSSLDTLTGTDNFGHAAGQDRCVLHVRGILVNVSGRGKYGIDCEATKPYAFTHANWDSVDMAVKLSATTALIFKSTYGIGGILLKPVNGSPDRKDRFVWERCGYIHWKCRGMDGSKHCCKTLGFERHGLTCGDDGALKRNGSTQSALEDVYIV